MITNRDFKISLLFLIPILIILSFMISGMYSDLQRLDKKHKTCGIVKRKYSSTYTKYGKTKELFQLKVNDTIITVDEKEFNRWVIGQPICIVGNEWKIDTIINN